jgi:nucleotide-binding universal stress UspA family protein
MKRILVGFDGSEPATHALDQACGLAAALGSELAVLTAAADRLVRHDGVVTLAVDEDVARSIAESGAERARQAGVAGVVVRTSIEAPDDALVLAAEEGYDLLVVGHRGLGALRELLMGSTAKSVVDRASCSVLVVR